MEVRAVVNLNILKDIPTVLELKYLSDVLKFSKRRRAARKS